jgi:hypothetical protein
MNRQVLFIGNGPNRAVTDEHGWSTVLTRLAIETGQATVAQGSQSRPFTLMYEELAMGKAKCGEDEKDLKRLVAEWMTILSHNVVHERLMDLDVQDVLTTNYDYCLERATEAPVCSADKHSESRYSLFRCRETQRKRVWHLHGEIEKPATIMLGHDQYVGYLHKARNYLTTLEARSRSSKYDYRSPVLHGQYDFENNSDGYSWLDVFLRDDVHIAGFSCDYSEIAMWWLIGYKERLRMRDTRLPKQVKVGSTHFYCFTEDAAREPLQGQTQILRDLGVHIVTVDRGASYLHGWQKMCTTIQQAV